MKASYKLNLEQHQRRLGLSHKELNKLDRKHNNINLIKQLQLFNPAGNNGFWGVFQVENVTGVHPRYMDVYLAVNDVPLTSTERIYGDTLFTFIIDEEYRLPSPSSILQFKFTFENGIQNINIAFYEGFTPIANTSNPLDEENTLTMFVNENNLNPGHCEIVIITTYEP